MRRSLTKSEIVRKKSDIDAIFREGRRYASSWVRLIVRKNGLEHNRMIVIPVRKYGPSHQRNKIRRQVKEIWRVEKINFSPGFDFAFVVYPKKVLDHATQKKELLDLFSQAGVYPQSSEL